MAYIGESRNGYTSPWEHVICLRRGEGNLLLPTLASRLKHAEERLEYYQGLHEVGTITERQEQMLDRWQNEVDVIGSVISTIKAI